MGIIDIAALVYLAEKIFVGLVSIVCALIIVGAVFSSIPFNPRDKRKPRF